jgi:hypothetical protein
LVTEHEREIIARALALRGNSQIQDMEVVGSETGLLRSIREAKLALAVEEDAELNALHARDLASKIASGEISPAVLVSMGLKRSLYEDAVFLRVVMFEFMRAYYLMVGKVFSPDVAAVGVITSESGARVETTLVRTWLGHLTISLRDTSVPATDAGPLTVRLVRPDLSWSSGPFDTGAEQFSEHRLAIDSLAAALTPGNPQAIEAYAAELVPGINAILHDYPDIARGF